MLTSSAVNTVCSQPPGGANNNSESATSWRFLAFAAGLVLIPAACSLPAPDNSLCQAVTTDEQVRIRHVIDGDTVVLADGEKLRLIGVDTPEIAYEGRSSEAGAIRARDFLRDLLVYGRQYPLRYDSEARDHYGRRLGHLFLDDGRNVQALLLAQGQATPLTLPPNLQFSDCYQQQAQQARQASRGIWALEQYQARASSTLSGRERGYHVVNGLITRIGKSRSSLWLNLGQELAIRIPREDLGYFPGIEFDGLVGKRVQVRGKIYYRNGQLRLRLRHENDLRLLAP